MTDKNYLAKISFFRKENESLLEMVQDLEQCLQTNKELLLSAFIRENASPKSVDEKLYEENLRLVAMNKRLRKQKAWLFAKHSPMSKSQRLPQNASRKFQYDAGVPSKIASGRPGSRSRICRAKKEERRKQSAS